MNRVVYKYELRPLGDFPLDIPEGAEFLAVRGQKNKPELWALVDPAAPITKVWFRVVLTGEKRAAEDLSGIYVGTFLIYDGDFVGHVFLIEGRK